MANDRYYFETHGTVQHRPAAPLRETGIGQRQDLGIVRLLGELDLEIRLLTESIASEEQATRVTDPETLKYSLAAKSMRGRRDNLLKTKNALLSRLNPTFSQMAASGSQEPVPDVAMPA